MLRGLLILVMLAGGLWARADAAAEQADVRFPGIAGGDVALADYRGQPMLIANTASLCGFTPQYEELQALWERYRDAGLIVIGVPTNDFGNQEPGSEAEIKEFCEVNFNISFPLTAKVTSRGADRHPFFGEVETALGPEALPRWNFHKFLIGRDGRLKAAWPSHVRPTGAEIANAIEAELAATPPG